MRPSPTAGRVRGAGGDAQPHRCRQREPCGEGTSFAQPGWGHTANSRDRQSQPARRRRRRTQELDEQQVPEQPARADTEPDSGQRPAQQGDTFRQQLGQRHHGDGDGQPGAETSDTTASRR